MKIKFDLLDDEMEGVWFNATIDDITGQVSNVIIDPAFDDDYWQNFNHNRMLQRAQEALESCIADYPNIQQFYQDCVVPGCSIEQIS